MVNLIQSSLQTGSESSDSAKFTFTELADTANNFTSFGGIALNNNGVVAFSGGKDASGITGIYTSDGNTITTIADLNTVGTLFADTQSPAPGETSRTNSLGGVAINNTDSVLFEASVNINNPGMGIDSITSRLYLSTSDGFQSVAQIESYSDPMYDVLSSSQYTGFGVNDSGQIVDSIDTTSGPSRSRSESTEIFGGQSMIGGFSSPRNQVNSRVYDPVINNQGTLFYAQSESGGMLNDNNIFRLGTGDTTPVAVADQPLDVQSLAANDQGTIVFSGSLASGETGLFLIDNGVITEVNNQQGNAKINNLGTIAFQPSQTSTTPTGIFTTSDGVQELVIAPGDPLLGSTVADVQFGGINDAGQVAFVADLTDGTEGIFRADPLYAGYGNGNILAPIDVGSGNDLLTPLQNPPLSSVVTV